MLKKVIWKIANQNNRNLLTVTKIKTVNTYFLEGAVLYPFIQEKFQPICLEIRFSIFLTVYAYFL